MGESSGLKFIEIEFDNWRILNPRRFSISGLLALGGFQEGGEGSSEMLCKGDFFSEENSHNSNELFKWASNPNSF